MPIALESLAGRETVAAATARAIREKILDGGFGEGEPLRQDAIAAELGVSRIPVREALRQLEAEGLVTTVAHRGSVVSALSIEDILEHFQLRAMLESDLVLRAAPSFDSNSSFFSRAILNDFDAAFASHDVAAWGDLNWQFHRSLYLAANRPITLAIVEKLHRHTDRYARMQLVLTRGERQANREHHELLRAMTASDGEGAAKLLSAHILGAGDALVDFLRIRSAAQAGSQSKSRQAR